MKPFRGAIALAIFVCTMLVSLTVSAQASRRGWVSTVGDDVNPCTRTAPCKTFAGAVAKVAADANGYASALVRVSRNRPS